jgi:hypothetical protein
MKRTFTLKIEVQDIKYSLTIDGLSLNEKKELLQRLSKHGELKDHCLFVGDDEEAIKEVMNFLLRSDF